MTVLEAFDLYNSIGLDTLPTNLNKSPYRCATWKDVRFDKKNFDGAHGIGIKCGKCSNNLEVIDFDNHFEDAANVLGEVKKQVIELFEKHNFPIEQTMNGGFHLLFRCEKIGSNDKLARRPKTLNSNVPDTLIETRGEGGYIVSAPTEGYRWIRGNIKSIPVISPNEREDLLNACRVHNTFYKSVNTEFEVSNRPGDEYNNTSECGSDVVSQLTASGWVEVRTGHWRRPDKKDGISATLGKVAPNIFYVFSSNAYPFESEKGYTPFQVIGLLKYNGDFKRFASELAERYNIKRPERKDYSKVEVKKLDINKLESILNESYIDLLVPISRPPTILKIRDFDNGCLIDRRLFTLGNFSAITGKSKSKKSLLASLFLAACAKNSIIDNKFIGCLPSSKNGVLLFDTEQSSYDTYRYSKNVVHKINDTLQEIPSFVTFNLREYSPVERCEIIDFALTRYRDEVGYIVIDGIADLVNAINDEIEATRVITLLMKWTKQFNCHITVNIHQNKNDNFATGWIGSYILKKAECVISVTKDPTDSMRSKVECQDIRGTAEFKDFDIEIHENGLPLVSDLLSISNSYEVKEVPF